MTEGLDHRSRDEDGTIRKKRIDTVIGTLRKIYGKHFARGHRADMTLGKLLDEQNEMTLSSYLKRH